MLAGLGSIVVRRVARMRPRVGWADPRMSLFFAIAVAGGLGGLVEIHTWGAAVRVAAEGLALVFCVRGIPLVWAPAVFAAAALGVTGHAAFQPQALGAEFADIVHVLSAAMWAGGILALGGLRPPGGWASAEARALLERFGRVAIIAFGVTALTGLLRASEQLRDVSDLWSTAYGAVLSVKMAGVLVMLAVSGLWRRGMPVAGADVGVAAGVVFATAVLAAFPPQA